MRAYEISAGTKSLVLSKPKGGQWATQDFITSKDLMFTDVVIDPIRVYNGNCGFARNSTLYKLAERGYMVFKDDITDRYLLAVHLHAVNVI